MPSTQPGNICELVRSNGRCRSVTPDDDAPIAVDDSYQIAVNTSLVIDATGGVLVNDSDVDLDALQSILQADTSNGALILNGDGSFTYTPNPDFTGNDSFTYELSDGIAVSATSGTMIQIWFRAQARRSTFRRRQIPSRLATLAEALSSILWAGTAALAAAGTWLALVLAVFALMTLAGAWAIRPREAHAA